MELFHKFESRYFQFALELLTILERRGWTEKAKLYPLAGKYGLEDWPQELLDGMKEVGILRQRERSYALEEDFVLPQLPMSRVEEDYLSYALGLEQRRLFLRDGWVPETAETGLGEKVISHYAPRYQAPPPTLGQGEFRLLIRAIREKRWISYRYRTRESEELRGGRTVPWRLEYNVYDCRWWLIHYDPEQDRTIKSVVNHLSQIRLEEASGVSQEQIEQAMERLLMPEPAVLRIQDRKNALERCAMTFERQAHRTLRREADGSYEMSFRYYRFDELEILKNLMYLGSEVRLRSPRSLQEKLLELIGRAAENLQP